MKTKSTNSGKIPNEINIHGIVPNLALYKTAAKNISAQTITSHTKVIKVALAASYTITGLSDVLMVLAAKAGINLVIYEVPYKQYNQYIFDPKSHLCTFSPDIVFLLFDPYTVFSGLADIQLTTKKGGYTRLKHSFSNSIAASIEILAKKRITTVFSLLPTYTDSVVGRLAPKLAGSKKRIINAVNNDLILRYQTNKHVFPFSIDSIGAVYGWDTVHNPKMYYLGDYFIAPDYLPALGYQLMGYIKALAGKTRKCIVVDLDNTLWGGILGEDGYDAIALGPTPPGNAFVHFQNVLLEYYHRGILLAVNSSNNASDVQMVLQKHPHMVLKEKHFAAFQVNWENKAINIKHIAETLNIGMDSLVFIDDDPKKRELVRHLYPEVLTVELPSDPALYARTLLSLNDFMQLNLTLEDMRRGSMYYQQSKRQVFRKETKDLNSYLKSLQVRLKFVAVNDFNIPRISQLTQRTNQFNTTTRRYSQSDIKNFLDNDEINIYAVEVTDRFGSYGICGVVITKRKNNILVLDTFLLSCRVLGIGIEDALIYEIVTNAEKKGIKKILGLFFPTAKNQPAEEFYKRIGFQQSKPIKPRLVKQKHIIIEYE